MSTVQDVVNRVRRQLSDEDGTRWSDSELLAYVNDGLRQTVVLKPEANLVELLFTPADDAPLQKLPANAVKLVKVSSNTVVTPPADP